MRIGTRLLLAFLLLVGLGAWSVFRIFAEEVKPGVRQGMENALVDTAHLLAELAGPELEAGRLQDGPFARAVARYAGRRPVVHMWGVEDHRADLRVYVTDARGVVVYDSDGTAVGQDYSRWNDVLLTLQGKYGARSTRRDPKDPATSVMYVAAPVRDGNRILGVLTVAKPTASVTPFAERSRRRVLNAGLALLGAALLIGLGFTAWLGRAVGRLQAYARKVAEGEKAPVPDLGRNELAELGQALGTMREKLEGRQYLEHYVQSLTHEMKSPLAAIRGAVELLEEDPPEPDRRRFTAHIREHETRLERLVDRMLGQAAVEQLQGLREPALLDLASLAESVAGAKAARCEAQGLRLEVAVPPGARALGDAFLLQQALSNLLDNALDFSPAGGAVALGLESTPEAHVLTVRDAGPGIPDYARERLFERFYSLPRPGTDRKSTGLGLSFVKEVAALHGGAIEVRNHPEGGAEARLSLPKA